MSNLHASKNRREHGSAAGITDELAQGCSGAHAHCCDRANDQKLENGLAHEHGHERGDGPAREHAPVDSCCTPATLTFQALAAQTAVGDAVRTQIRIRQMDCPTEEALIRKKLAGMRAVTGMEFNLMQRVLTVVHKPEALTPVLEGLRSLGFSRCRIGSGSELGSPGRPAANMAATA